MFERSLVFSCYKAVPYFPLLMCTKRLRMVEKSGRAVDNSSQQSRISCSSWASLIVSFSGIGGRNGGVSPPLTRTNMSVNEPAKAETDSGVVTLLQFRHVAQRVERWTCDQQVVGSNHTRGTKLRNNLGQVVHTYVPLSPSSITYSAAGLVIADLVKSNGSLPPGWWLIVTCGLTACTPGSAPGPTLGNEYGKPLPV